jgi:hypothetical protein
VLWSTITRQGKFLSVKIVLKILARLGHKTPFFGITSEWVRGIYFGLNTPTHVLMPFMEKESGIKHYVVNA